jgi:hypothetical protein
MDATHTCPNELLGGALFTCATQVYLPIPDMLPSLPKTRPKCFRTVAGLYTRADRGLSHPTSENVFRDCQAKRNASDISGEIRVPVAFDFECVEDPVDAKETRLRAFSMIICHSPSPKSRRCLGRIVPLLAWVSAFSSSEMKSTPSNKSSDRLLPMLTP